MKQLKTILLATALCLVTISFTQAQGKVAHINTQELIAAMPEAVAAQAELETLGKSYQTVMQDMATEYKNLLKQYDAEVTAKTDEENQERYADLAERQQRMQTYEAKARQDLAKKEAELFKPIQEKAFAAINKVAKAQGYEYVLEETRLIVSQGKDILADVKKELGI